MAESARPEPARVEATPGATRPLAARQIVDGPVIVEQAAGGDDDTRLDRATFLRRMRDMASTTAIEMLGERAVGCPYIEAWFARHADLDAMTLERMARRYSGLPGATTAGEILDAIRARLRLGIAYWRNGEDLSGELELAGLPRGEAAASAIAGAIAGDARQAGLVVAALDEGEPVPSVPGARIHTDARAARIAASAEATAFTIGRDVVLAADAPRPGTVAGDLLLAHELAHVEQQRAGGTAAPREAEAHADAAAIDVVARRSGVGGRLAEGSRRVVGSPLSLQRCKSDKDKKIKAYEDRLDVLTKTKDAKGSFGEVGAAIGESTAIEHWLGVLKTGKGGQTGTESGETGLPRCNCTTYVVDVLAATFTALGRSSDWDKVKKKALALNDKGETGFNGIPLQRALESELGWKGVFWAPDPSYDHYRRRKRNADGSPMLDAAGQQMWKEDWEHKTSWKGVQKTGQYYKVDIAHSVINYAPEPGTAVDAPVASKTKKDTTQLEKLETIPFAVLTARGGLHMALLIHGVVYEVHWDQSSSSANLYAATPLEDWGWDSGVIVAPAEDVDKAFK